jgi:hypothetical protein
VLHTREPGEFRAGGLRYNASMHRNPATLGDRDARPSSARGAAPARASPGVPVGPVSVVAGTDWLGSSFDLAQGLDVKVMESKLSRETLDELFRS